MKKLKKLSLKNVKNEICLLSKQTQKEIIGGSGTPIDWNSASDAEKIEAILEAISSGECYLDDLFSNFTDPSFTSNRYGTEVTIDGQTFNVVLIIGNFDDNYASYGYEFGSEVHNAYGDWEAINIGNNGIMRILVEYGQGSEFIESVYKR